MKEERGSRKRIQKAALTLFREKGYENTTINEICRAADCSPSTFYYQFGSKDKLVENFASPYEVVDQFLLVSLLSLPTAWQKLWRIHQSFVASVVELGASLYFRKMTLTMNQGENWSESEKTVFTNNLIVPIIREGQRTGEIRNHTPAEELAMTVTVQMLGVCFSWCLDHGSFDLEQRMKQMLTNLYDLRRE